MLHIYMYIHILMHTYKHTYTHICIYVYTHLSISMCIYIYIDMSCFRAGGVHSLQTHTIRIPLHLKPLIGSGEKG